MFTINNALHYIEAAESSVIAVHRSQAGVFMALEGHRQQSCDAFLCVVRGNGAGEQIYAAIHLAVSKETLVYTPNPSLSPVPASKSIPDALSFLEAMGFQMEVCNLEVSAALRSVIIRGIKVLQPPEAGAKLFSPKPAVSQTPVAKPVASAGAACIEREPLEVNGAAAGDACDPESTALRAELERVSAEKSDLAATTSLRIAALERDLAAARSELAQLAASGEASAAIAQGENHAAENGLSLLQEEYEALRSEYMLINEELTDRHTDLQLLRSESAAAREAADLEIAALRATIAQLAADKLTAGELCSERVAAGGEAATPEGLRPAPIPAEPTAGSPAVREKPGREAGIPLAPAHHAFAPPREGSETPAQEQSALLTDHEHSSFHLDSSLTAIPCVSTDDVIDLRVSFNTVRMSGQDGKDQNCSAYICGLERNGSKQIYVALFEVENKRAKIYVPARQPADAADYDRVMESAISFADVVGFIINLEYLGGGREARAKIFRQIPVLGNR
jgi:hypothetical protein